MNYRLAAILTLAMWLSVPSTWGEATGVQQESAAQEAEQEPAPPPLAVPEDYPYNPGARRDPFVNPVPPPVVDTGPVIPIIRPPGLVGVLLGEARLTGLISSGGSSMNIVVIVAPGNRTYFASPGDELFDAVVKEIRPGVVVFEMKPLEGQEEPEEREEVVRTIGTAPGE